MKQRKTVVSSEAQGRRIGSCGCGHLWTLRGPIYRLSRCPACATRNGLRELTKAQIAELFANQAA
jgi:hypothetical protein